MQNKDPHRCFVASELLSTTELGKTFVLPVDVAHRASKVLRLKKDALISLFDGSGKTVLGKIIDDNKIEVIELTQSAKKQNSIILAQAMTKWSKLEEVVQRCTEMGVDEIVLFFAERSLISPDKDYTEKIERLNRIAQDASRQSGRSHVPVVHYPQPFQSIVSLCTNFSGIRLVGVIETKTSLLNTVIQHKNIGLKDGVLVIIGPEGDLSLNEHAQLTSHAIAVNFGPHVLRTETAGLVALAIILSCLTC